MDIEEIFATHLQVRLIRIFLENPSKLYSCTKLARVLGSSPSAIISRLRQLKQLGLIKVIQISRVKLYKLNIDSPLANLLLDFYRKLKKITQTNMDQSEHPDWEQQ